MRVEVDGGWTITSELRSHAPTLRGSAPLVLEEPGAPSWVVRVAKTIEFEPVFAGAFNCDPGPDSGFQPGLLLVPETDTLFVGAGRRAHAVWLRGPTLLTTAEVECGFWGWHRAGPVVLMAAELEFAAWTLAGQRVWSTFVEPPWRWSVEGEVVQLDVMGSISTFPLTRGP